MDYAALVGDGKFIQLPCHPITDETPARTRPGGHLSARSSRATRKPTSTPSRPVLPPAGNGTEKIYPLIMRIRQENKGRSNQGKRSLPGLRDRTFHWWHRGIQRSTCEVTMHEPRDASNFFE